MILFENRHPLPGLGDCETASCSRFAGEPIYASLFHAPNDGTDVTLDPEGIELSILTLVLSAEQKREVCCGFLSLHRLGRFLARLVRT
jgi:hypothetical protein